MKNKGFTLVELLSVIVLLSLLALLVVPKVLEQKEKKEKEIYESKKKVLFTDASTYIKENNSEDIVPGQVFCIGVDSLIDEGYISMDADDFASDIVKLTVDENGNFVSSLDGNCAGAIVINGYKEELLNGTDPVLNSDMIPVTISNDGKVKKANIKSEWYKYAEKKWANAVVLITKKTYSDNEEIPEDNIKAYYVWIPRYKYKLFSNTTESTIDITFENRETNKSRNTTVGQYYTHPAFTFGDKELNGFWVGKFETSVVETDACYTSANETNCNKELTNPRIKPNVKALRYQQAANQFKTSQKVSINSRMMKNDEWGAVAYLSHSNYGIKSKVRINNNNSFKLGCGADTDGKVSSSNCDITYGASTSYPQSTTGDISGIFDMSGGSQEYMMAVRADSNGAPLSGRNNLKHSGFNGTFGSPGSNSSDSEILSLTSGIDFPNSKYYNLFDNPTNRSSITYDNGCNGSKCYGHALTEIVKTAGSSSSWYGEKSSVNYPEYPWIYRGGDWSDSDKSGVFSFNASDGSAHSNFSFRVVATQ